MTSEDGAGERAPLLRHASTPSQSVADGKDVDIDISVKRGAVIIASVGLLIFLQGKSVILWALGLIEGIEKACMMPPVFLQRIESFYNVLILPSSKALVFLTDQ